MGRYRQRSYLAYIQLDDMVNLYMFSYWETSWVNTKVRGSHHRGELTLAMAEVSHGRTKLKFNTLGQVDMAADG